MTEQEQKIRFIESGVVIDHIQPGSALTIAELLGLTQVAGLGARISIGMNYPSKIGQKDFVKIEGFDLTPSVLAYVALISPEATINIIREFRVVEKLAAQVPDDIGDVVWCPDRFCITNHEDVPGLFQVVDRDPLTLRCSFCETRFYDRLIRFKSPGERRLPGN